jgi:hypothetical protein
MSGFLLVSIYLFFKKKTAGRSSAAERVLCFMVIVLQFQLTRLISSALQVAEATLTFPSLCGGLE